METASRRPVDPRQDRGRARVASAATPAVPGGRGAAVGARPHPERSYEDGQPCPATGSRFAVVTYANVRCCGAGCQLLDLSKVCGPRVRGG